MRLKTLRVTAPAGPAKGAPTDPAGNSTDPADWQSALAGIAVEFAKVGADNLRNKNQTQAERSQAEPPFNWKPWAIGGAVALTALVVVFKVLK